MEQSSLTHDDVLVENKLMRSLVDFIQHSHDHERRQCQMHMSSVDSLGETLCPPFSLTILSHLRQCVKSVVISHMEKSKLRQALLSSRGRAEVLHLIVQVGDQITQHTDDISLADWIQIKEAFMSMLDS